MLSSEPKSHSELRSTTVAKDSHPAHFQKPVPANSGPLFLLGMQQALGNQGMQRMLGSVLVQDKITLNKPGDQYEQEAGRIADRVMKMLDSPTASCQESSGRHIQRMCAGCEEEEKLLHTKPVSHDISRDSEGEATDEVESAIEGAWAGGASSTNGISPHLVLQRNGPPAPGPSAPNPAAPAPAPAPRSFHPTITVTDPGHRTTDCGAYTYGVRWGIPASEATTSGWIVQKVNKTFAARDCAGHPVAPQSIDDPSGYPFWEAWEFTSGRNVWVGPASGGSRHSADTFGGPNYGNGTSGRKVITGEVKAIVGFVPPPGMTVRNAAPAWSLPYTRSEPPQFASTPTGAAHTLTAEWNCCPDGTVTQATAVATNP
jgi:hypothetical protein